MRYALKKICYRTRERQREVVRDGDRVRIVDTRKSARERIDYSLIDGGWFLTLGKRGEGVTYVTLRYVTLRYVTLRYVTYVTYVRTYVTLRTLRTLRTYVTYVR